MKKLLKIVGVSLLSFALVFSCFFLAYKKPVNTKSVSALTSNQAETLADSDSLVIPAGQYFSYIYVAEMQESSSWCYFTPITFRFFNRNFVATYNLTNVVAFRYYMDNGTGFIEFFQQGSDFTQSSAAMQLLLSSGSTSNDSSLYYIYGDSNAPYFAFDTLNQVGFVDEASKNVFFTFLYDKVKLENNNYSFTFNDSSLSRLNYLRYNLDTLNFAVSSGYNDTVSVDVLSSSSQVFPIGLLQRTDIFKLKIGRSNELFFNLIDNQFYSDSSYSQVLNYNSITFNSTDYFVDSFFNNLLYFFFYGSDISYLTYQNDQSYRNGFEAGQQIGYQSGLNDGYNNGYQAGYSVGRQDGFDLSQNHTFLGLLTAVFEVPVATLVGLLDFNLLGFNMLQFVKSLLALTILLFIIKIIAARS